MEYSGTWREIWTQKGQMEGGIEDLYIYDGWEKSKGDIKATAERITEGLLIKPSDRVLEVGCGAGALAQYMNCAYVGIDYSRTLLQKHVDFLETMCYMQRQMTCLFEINGLTRRSAGVFFCILIRWSMPGRQSGSWSE